MAASPRAVVASVSPELLHRLLSPEPSSLQPQPLTGQMSTRKERFRYRYEKGHEVAFVEPTDDKTSEEEFLQILEAVPGVRGATWQTSKREQGNPSTGAPGTECAGHGHRMASRVAGCLGSLARVYWSARSPTGRLALPSEFGEDHRRTSYRP